MRAVVAFPNGPRCAIATVSAQLLESLIALAVGPRHQIYFPGGNFLKHAARFTEFESDFLGRQSIEVPVPKTMRTDCDQRMPREVAQFISRDIAFIADKSGSHKNRRRHGVFLK